MVSEPPIASCSPWSKGNTCSVMCGSPAALSSRSNCSRMTARPPTGRRRTASSSTTHSAGRSGALRRFCRVRRASSLSSSCSSLLSVRPTRRTARAYASVWRRPGTRWAAYCPMSLARSESSMNARDQSGNASRYTYGHRSTSSPSASSVASSARVSSSVGRAPEARSIWVMRVLTTWVSAPSSACVRPAAVRSLRTREPNSAAMDVPGSIPLAKASLPFLTSRKVRLRPLSSVGPGGHPCARNVTARSLHGGVSGWCHRESQGRTARVGRKHRRRRTRRPHRAVALDPARCAPRPASRRAAHGGVGLLTGVGRGLRGGAGRRGACRERRAARQRPRAGLPARPRTRRGGGPGEGRGRRRGGGEEAAGGGALLVPRGRVRPGPAPGGRTGPALGLGPSGGRGQDGLGGGDGRPGRIGRPVSVVAVGEEFAGLVVDRDEAVVGLVAGGERGGDQLALALVGAEQSAGEVGEDLGGVEEVVALVGSGHLGDVLDGGLLSGCAGLLDAVLELLCLRPGLLGLVLLLLLGPRLVVGGDGLVLVAGVGGVVAAPAGRHRDEDGEGQQTGAAEAGDLADAALLRRLRHRRTRPERLGVAVSGLGLLRLLGVRVAHASSLEGCACLWHVRPVEGMCGCTSTGLFTRMWRSWG